jgi:hypothetical protein
LGQSAAQHWHIDRKILNLDIGSQDIQKITYILLFALIVHLVAIFLTGQKDFSNSDDTVMHIFVYFSDVFLVVFIYIFLLILPLLNKEEISKTCLIFALVSLISLADSYYGAIMMEPKIDTIFTVGLEFFNANNIAHAVSAVLLFITWRLLRRVKYLIGDVQ